MDGAPPPSIQNKRRPMVIAVPPPPRSSQNGHPRHNSAHSSTTSLSSEHHRVPGIIRYPSDSSNGVDYASSRNSTPLMNGCGSMQGPAIDRLREENARLRLRAEEITTDSNRRVEMHVAEIRMLKEETKRLRGAIGEMEGERNKARQLAHEWHKFARYSSDLVKQEVRSYDAKLKEAHGRLRRLREENVELRQICLYLDEQRHATTASRRLSARSEESDDQGCGSSDHSIEGGGEGYCLQKENSLRRICMGGEEEERTGGGGGEEKGEGLANDRLLSYIHSLESRIQHLELTTTGGGGGGVGGERREDTWRSSISPETDDLTVMEREWDGRETRERREGGENMGGSTSTMTSSGTTFCSSSMDGDDHNLMMMMTSPSSGGSSVFVDGSEGGYGHLEVRTLPPIEEELKDDLSASTERGEDGGEKRISQEVALSALLPPCMEPISSSSIGLGRYRTSDCGSSSSSTSSSSRLPEMRLVRGGEEPGLRMSCREPRSVSEAVDALRMREQRAAAAAAASAQQLQHTENLYARWSPSEPKYHLSAL